MAKVQEVTLESTGSHHVSDEYARGGYREQVFGYFKAEWRGLPVIVTMQADRYTHSSGLSDWRIYAESARYYDADANGGRGADVTDLARQRLSEACRPAMSEWLHGDEYAGSLSRAVRNMIVRQIGEKYGNNADRLLTTYADRLTLDQAKAIRAALVARDSFRAAMETASNA